MLGNFFQNNFEVFSTVLVVPYTYMLYIYVLSTMNIFICNISVSGFYSGGCNSSMRNRA